MGAVCGCNRGTAMSAEQNLRSQGSTPMRVSKESAPTVGCEVPAVAHEQMPPVEVAEDSSSWDDNKRVQEARRARVQWLESLRRNCATEEEFQTARTKPMWTQVDSSSSSCSSSSSPAHLQLIHEKNRLYFQHLMNNEVRKEWYPHSRYRCPPTLGGRLSDPVSRKFYVDFGDALKVGEKIGGGGQADIHEAIYNGKVQDKFVLKVFKGACLLSDLQRTWSKDIGLAFRGVGRTNQVVWKGLGQESENYCGINHGTLLRDGQFAFVLERCWGDLRKYIDLQIVKDKTHQKCPFPHFKTLQIMEDIALGMLFLHYKGILHKDLKAANCLILRGNDKYDFAPSKCLVADYESSVGVVGTRFWRAPEILLALRNSEKDNDSIQDVWTKMADVYSYAMTCYEVLTGCIPFEGYAASDYDSVIAGERPPMPDYMHPKLLGLVRRCWHPEPSMRPTFHEIVRDLQHMHFKAGQCTLEWIN